MFNFDNQLLYDFARCEVAGLIRHTFNRESKAEKLAADIGNTFHTALESFFNGAVIDDILNTWAWNYSKIIPTGSVPTEDRFEFNNCQTILRTILESRPLEHWPFTVLETERTVGVNIAPGMTFWAKRDMLVRDKQTGAVYPVDHKTTHKISDWWANKFKMNSQFSGYIWVTREAANSLCDSIGVNAIEIAKLPDSNRKCKSHGVPYLECRARHVVNKFLNYTRTEEQLESWHRDACRLAQHIQSLIDTVNGSLNRLSTIIRGGTFRDSCTFCGFANWCRTGLKPAQLDFYTVESKWAPWDSAK